MLERVPQVRVNGGQAPRTPNTTNVMFAGIEGEALVIALDLKGLACSVGAACSSGAVEPSHVLTAIGLSQEEAKSSLRFSLGRHTTESEIDFALEVIPAAVAQLRALSPTYQRGRLPCLTHASLLCELCVLRALCVNSDLFLPGAWNPLK